MLSKSRQATDMMRSHESADSGKMSSRSIKYNGLFSTRARFYKTPNLKDPQIFFAFTIGHIEKKRKINDRTDENTGTLMIHCV